jgi:hypothetical protein
MSRHEPREHETLASVFAGLVVLAVASVPVLVATGLAPHWAWIFF